MVDVDEVVQFLRDLDTSKACAFHLAFYKKAPLKLHQAYVYCLTVLYIQEMFLVSGNQQMSLLSIKKISRNLRNITDQYPCCPSSLSTLSQKRSMAFCDGDLALLSYYQYYTLSDSPWTKTSKLTSSTSILQKHSTLSITKFFSTSLRRMVCQASFMIGLWTISVVVVKE